MLCADCKNGKKASAFVRSLWFACSLYSIHFLSLQLVVARALKSCPILNQKASVFTASTNTVFPSEHQFSMQMKCRTNFFLFFLFFSLLLTLFGLFQEIFHVSVSKIVSFNVSYGLCKRHYKK